jgi:hypothetical protein
MRQPTPQEIEALRQRWREILKRAQEKGEHPTYADIQAANASNDPMVADLFAQTEKALEDYLDNRLSRLNTDPEDFRPAKRPPSVFKMIAVAEMLTNRTPKRKP